jgi:hypothetical protein
MMQDDYILQLNQENAFLRAAAYGLSSRLTHAESLLTMAMEFMMSVSYDTTMDSMQCVSILNTIKDFLKEDIEK